MISKGLFKITPGLKNHHNYRLDTSFTGRYLTRRADGSLVYLDRVSEKPAGGAKKNR